MAAAATGGWWPIWREWQATVIFVFLTIPAAENSMSACLRVAVGDNAVRERLCRRVTVAGFHLINLVHPSAVISPSVTLGIGVVVMPLAVINADARVGDGAIINTAAVVEHDCMIGAYAHVCPRVALAGNVAVGERVQIGIGSCVIQGLSIGAGSIVGAGSVVVKNTAANVVTFGSPAQVYRKLA